MILDNLKYGENIIFDCACECGFIENLYNNGYYYQLLFATPTSTSTRATVIFNGIDNGISEKNILECIIGVVCNGIGNNRNVNKMIIGM